MILNAFCKVVPRGPELLLHCVIAMSPVLDKGYLEYACRFTPEVMPKTLELAQLHTAAEEVVLNLQHRSPEWSCLAEVSQ